MQDVVHDPVQFGGLPVHIEVPFGIPLDDFSGLAGVIEFFGGLAIAFGFFTRLVATAAALEMIVAFFMVHVKQGWIPFLNQGELALLYFASFLALIVLGNKKWNLEQALLKKEVF